MRAGKVRSSRRVVPPRQTGVCRGFMAVCTHHTKGMSTEDRFDRQIERLVERYDGRVDYEEMELILQRHAQAARARRDDALATREEREQDT